MDHKHAVRIHLPALSRATQLAVPAPRQTPPQFAPELAAIIASYEELPTRKLAVYRELAGLGRDQAIPAPQWVQLVGSDWRVLLLVPEQERTELMYAAAVTQDSIALSLVPFAQRTQKLCDMAFAREEPRRPSGERAPLRRVPLALQAHFFKAAVERDGGALRFIPPELRTRELCDLALQAHPRTAAMDVPDELWDDPLCRVFFEQPALEGSEPVPAQLIARLSDADLRELAIVNGLPLQYFTAHRLDARQTNLAIQRATEHRRAVDRSAREADAECRPRMALPGSLTTPQACLDAVVADPVNLLYVDSQLMSSALCLVAVQQNGSLLEAVPKRLASPAIYLAAVRQYPAVLRQVPSHMRTPEMQAASDAWQTLWPPRFPGL
ncbi:hypothetical protein JI739_01305 [Ramlibacter sp. AW1]|uniref:Uncharacterized protein n=2 Tax=Ramlibacter aurantiacus TaxID=2801330 RepID=A0A937D5Q0_9BURK|nr:hypothetical protein [Ramlibacter aurantiacus]